MIPYSKSMCLGIGQKYLFVQSRALHTFATYDLSSLVFLVLDYRDYFYIQAHFLYNFPSYIDLSPAAIYHYEIRKWPFQMTQSSRDNFFQIIRIIITV